MSISNTEHIKHKVKCVKLSHGDRNIFEIFEYLNFAMGYIPDNYPGTTKPKGCNIQTDDLRSILIDPSLEDKHLLEVYAHELGHIYLHPTINTFEIHKIDSVWSRKLEIEADVFASEFLIDDDVFENYVMNFEDIASTIGVSVSLLKLKFDNLSMDKKRKLEELYINNYYNWYSI